MQAVWTKRLAMVALLLAEAGAPWPAGGPDPAHAQASAGRSRASGFQEFLRQRSGRGEEEVRPGHSFYFSRAVYTGRRWSWRTDFPKADRQFLAVLRRLAHLDAYELENPVALDDPEVRRYPFLYAVEVGRMALTDEEVRGLREYLLAGGFLMVDDFWGTYEWRAFSENMHRVFPEYPIVEIPLDHPLFSTYYDIDEVLQVPQVGRGMRGGPTHERDGYVPHVRGIFDDRGRLMVAINWNTDLGDAWEWAEQPAYPLKYSTYAFRIAVNFIVYAMSH